jgi:hypothetical protein
LPSTLKIGNVFANPGETRWGAATFVELRDSTRVSLPVILVKGVEEGPRVVIHGGTHPVELAGIAAAQIIARKRVNPKKLKGSIIVFPLTNPFGYQFGDYMSPHDVVNMVSAYPGSSEGSVTSRFANFIWENASKKADLVIDLHENVKPCLQFILVGRSNGSKIETKALELAEAFGLSIARPSTGRSRLPGMRLEDIEYYELCLQNGVPAFEPELESSTDISFDESYHGVKVAVRGVMNCLKKLGMVQGAIEPQSDTKVLRGRYVFHETIPSNRGGIVNRLAEVGVKLSKGTPVANVIDPNGQVLETLSMPVNGYIWGWNLGAPPFYQWGVQSGDGVAYVYVDEKGA